MGKSHLLVLLASLCLLIAANGQIVFVDSSAAPSPSCGSKASPCRDLKAAIGRCVPSLPECVLSMRGVFDQTLARTLTFNRSSSASLTMRSESGSATTLVGLRMDVRGSNLTLLNVAVTGTVGIAFSLTRAHCTVSNSSFFGNVGSVFAVDLVTACSLSVSLSRFESNVDTASGWGSVLRHLPMSIATITSAPRVWISFRQCTFARNGRGSLAFWQTTMPTDTVLQFRSCVFEENSAMLGYFQLVLPRIAVTVDSCVVRRHRSATAFVIHYDLLRITRSAFLQHRGSISLLAAAAVIEDTLFDCSGAAAALPLASFDGLGVIQTVSPGGVPSPLLVRRCTIRGDSDLCHCYPPADFAVVSGFRPLMSASSNGAVILNGGSVRFEDCLLVGTTANAKPLAGVLCSCAPGRSCSFCVSTCLRWCRGHQWHGWQPGRVCALSLRQQHWRNRYAMLCFLVMRSRLLMGYRGWRSLQEERWRTFQTRRRRSTRTARLTATLRRSREARSASGKQSWRTVGPQRHLQFSASTPCR